MTILRGKLAETTLSVGSKSLKRKKTPSGSQTTFDALPLDIQNRIFKDVVAIQINGAHALQRQKNTLMEMARRHQLLFVDVPLRLAEDICVFCGKYDRTYLYYNMRMSGTDEHAKMATCPTCHHAHSSVLSPGPGINKKGGALVIGSEPWVIQGQDLGSCLKATPWSPSEGGG